MRVRFFSDLHLEFGPFEPPPAEADVVVLAGDVHLGVRGVRWAREAFPDKPVVYVPGNHEYYGHALPRLTEKMRDAARDSQVHVLDEEAVRIGDTTFLGATLWTDLELFGNRELAEASVQLALTDYERIRVSPKYRRLRPADTRKLHLYARTWLEAELARDPSGPAVVVTHHAPTPLSLDARFPTDPIQAGYASDLEELIRRHRPALWIHGHTHARHDYRVGETRVVCNPRGYTDEPVEEFDPAWTIEVPERS
jgi:Icc-related predicted phosphoesterase